LIVGFEGLKASLVTGKRSLLRESRSKRVFLPDTVVAELELNGVRPPPDKIEEEERDLGTKRTRENLIHKCNESVEIVEAGCKLPTPRYEEMG
jgi:hypothetical protein